VTVAGSAFNGFDAIVGYDPAALTLMALTPVSLQEGSMMTGACPSRFHRFKAGAGVDTMTDILLCAGVSVTGPGQIYKLHFKASNTPQLTAVRILPGTLKFYNQGVFVLPVNSTDAQIGIGVATTAVGDVPATLPVLTVAPNPSPGQVMFSTMAGRSGPESLMVRDVQGRLVRKFEVNGSSIAWDGTRESGEALPTGTYFATLVGAGRTTTIRFSLIR
jgi:hypothetical protein